MSVRVGSGRLRISVPASDRFPIRILLGARAFTVAPGQTRLLGVPGR